MLTNELAAETAEVGLDFADYMQDPFAIVLLLELTEDGSYHMEIDEQALDAMVDSFHTAMKAFFMDVLYTALKQSLGEQGFDVSSVNSMEDLEPLVGMSTEEMILASVGTDLDSFINEQFSKEQLLTLVGDAATDGSFTVVGDEIHMDDGTVLSYTLDGDTLTLDGDDDGAGLFPITLNRVR